MNTGIIFVMTIVKVPHYKFKNLLLIGLITLLAACGGGGSGESKSEPDTTPNAVSFTAVANAAPNTEVTSSAATISGIDAAATITVSGGQYAINNGAFTAAAGTVNNGQTVTVKVTAAATTNTPVTATVNIGGTKGTFTVTTLADLTPTTFSFVPATAVEPASVSTSAPVTVSGFDLPVPVSVSGGEYSINGGAYTTAVGTMSPNQTVTVRVTAAATTSADVSAVLTVGGVEGTYTVTTLKDEVAPTAEFMFPPPVSMTEGTTLLVRGKVADDYNTVANAQIIVNGAAPQDLVLTANEDGSASWQMEVALTAGQNTISITTEDSEGNTEPNAAQVSVKRDVALGSFPDAANPMPGPRAVVIDRLNGRNRLLVSEGFSAKVFSVDLETGARNLLTNFSGVALLGLTDILLHESANQLLVRDDARRIATMNLDDPSQAVSYTLPGLGAGFSFAFDDTNELKLMAANLEDGNLVQISLDFSGTTVFSDNTNVNQGAPMSASRGMTFDKANHRYLLASSANQTIYAVDSVTGFRSVLSGSGVGTGENFSEVGAGFLRGLKVDSENQRVLVLESNTGRIYSVDLVSGNRSIFSSPTVPNSLNSMDRLHGFAVDSFESYAYVTDQVKRGIIAVDLATGNRVYFSKN